MTRVLYATKANLVLKRAHTTNILETVEGLRATGMFAVEIIQNPTVGELVRRKDEFDVLYFRDHYLVLIALVAKYRLRKKVIYEAHSTHGFSVLRRLAFRIADGVVFITRKLQIAYDPRGKKVSRVVHCNGVDLADYRITDSPDAVRGQLQFPVGARIVLYVGSTLWYDLPMLFSTMKLLPSEFLLVCVGLKGLERQELGLKAKELGVGDKVLLRGRVEHASIPRYLFAADIVVNPLVAHLPGSISSKLYEYLASGRPIVSTYGGANDEILADRENCLIAKPTPEGFAERILEFNRNPTLAQRISIRACEDAKRYTKEARAIKIGELIRQIVR